MTDKFEPFMTNIPYVGVILLCKTILFVDSKSVN